MPKGSCFPWSPRSPSKNLADWRERCCGEAQTGKRIIKTITVENIRQINIK
jgi:hypothetical protein